jgi:intraflagellar transport protein 172
VHKLAQQHLPREEASGLLVQQAAALEARQRYADAEKMFLAVHEPDLAINMYKNLRQYDDMLRLVKSFHPDLVDQTHAHLAKVVRCNIATDSQELETDSHFGQAEQHFIAGNDWKVPDLPLLSA